MTARVYENFVGGGWAASRTGETMPVVNPADVEELVGHCQASGREDARQAIAVAKEAFPAWRRTPPPRRARVVRKLLELAESRAEELAGLMTLETGKLLSEARGEIAKGNTLLEWYAGEGLRIMGISAPSELADNFLYTVRKPLGVVGIITPWNFPWAIPCWKIAPALVAGNTVVFKPAESTPLLALRLAEMFVEAGLPPGVLNVLTGLGEVVGDEIVRHPDVRAISFTGSTEVGMRINEIAAKRLCKVSLEMGGKNAAVVFEDADLDLAVGGVLIGAFGNAGQRCTATSRVIVQDSVADAFVERLAERARALRIGPGLDPASQMGPLVNAEQHERVRSYVEIAKQEARLVLGGEPPCGKDLGKGYFVGPTIVDHVRPEMRIAQEEVFGPVLAVIRVRDYDEAVQVANGVVYGLTSAVYTRDLSLAMRFVDDVEAGMVHINSPTIGGEAQVPFGGIKSSGLGDREMAKEGLHFFTEQVTVFVDYTGGVRTSKIY
jgi:alpha-ketoglutaric semialdehyde dehydrogenase